LIASRKFIIMNSGQSIHASMIILMEIYCFKKLAIPQKNGG